MSKRDQFETKHVSFVMAHKGHARKFAALLADGWVVVSETKVGAFGSRVAYVMRRPNPKWKGAAA